MNLENLRDTVSNLTLYDIKAGVRKVQNAVMNYTEMEAKVREATTGEPWGASRTLMQEIANGTYNYQHLNEIMPMIYKRFTEKAADEWRQIYKALQLLEYLVKNGSERVIDDARSHLTLLKMLRQFHFIDQNGKDQGINVRNRAKELAELLSDVERIRSERKKSRSTRNKYSGVEGGAGLGGSGTPGSGRFGGLGSDDRSGYGGYSGGVYGDGGGFGGQTSDFQDSENRGAEKYEEYDEGDEDVSGPVPPSRSQPDSSSSAPSSRRTERTSRKTEAPKKKEPEVDLFSFEEPASSIPAQPTLSAASGSAEDDDFDDFQSATPTTTKSSTVSPPFAPNTAYATTANAQFAAPQPVSAPQAATLTNLTSFSSMSPAPSSNATPINYSAFSTPSMPTQPIKPTGYQSAQPNYFTSVQAPTSQSTSSASSALPSTKPAAVAKSSSGDAFGSLWSSASVGIKKTNTPNQGPALGQLAKEKASAGIWGASAPMTSSSSAQQPQKSQPSSSSYGNGLDDLI